MSGINKKTISLFTAIAFLFSVVAGDLHAATVGLSATHTGNISASNFQDIFQSKILIPHSYGKITSISDMQSDTVVINIQDLHSHGDTQRNIAKIIEVIDNGYNLSGVYVEGGIGNIDVSWIKQIENKELRNKLINNLVDEGDLTAGEYYYMTQDKEGALKGIEDANLHRDNIVRLANIESKKEQYEKIAKEISQNIEILNKIYTNHRNVRFNKTLDEYSEGKISDAKLYTVISKYVKAINENPERYNNLTKIRMADYPNIKFYMDMNEFSSKTNMDKVSQELQILLELMKEYLPYNAYRHLQEYTENFRNTEKLIEVIGSFAEKAEIDLSAKFRNLYTLIEINEAVNRLNPIELISEQRHLIERIKMALSYNDTEAEITYISDFKGYFKDYITASLPKEDWEYVKGRLDKFISIYEKYSGSTHLNEIKDDFHELIKYYEINTKRDHIFTTNLDITHTPPRTNSVEISPEARPITEILSNAGAVKIMITGGYHSKGLQELLAEKGLSAIVITPAVTSDINAANAKYSSMLKKQGKVFSESLACLIASSSTPLEQKALFIEAGARMFGINSPEFAQITKALKETGADIVIQEDKITVTQSGETADIVLTGKAAIPLKDMTESIKEILNSSVKPLTNLFNTKNPLQNITDIEYEILKTISLTLFKSGIYFSKDTTKEVQQAGYLSKDLDGVKYDVYKYFPSVIQNLLLQKELSKSGAIRQKNEAMVKKDDKSDDVITGEARLLNNLPQEETDAIEPQKFISKLKNNEIQDGELKNTINEIFGNLVNQMPIAQDYKLIITNDLEVNAFYIKGTKIVVLNYGYLLKMKEWLAEKGEVLTHDHVAAVLAHELTHSLQQFNDYSDKDEEDITDLAKRETLKIGESHKYEMNADLNGLRLADNAGYNPHATKAFFKYILETANYNISLSQSHPDSGDRLMLAEQFILNGTFKHADSDKVFTGNLNTAVEQEVFYRFVTSIKSLDELIDRKDIVAVLNYMRKLKLDDKFTPQQWDEFYNKYLDHNFKTLNASQKELLKFALIESPSEEYNKIKDSGDIDKHKSLAYAVIEREKDFYSSLKKLSNTQLLETYKIYEQMDALHRLNKQENFAFIVYIGELSSVNGLKAEYPDSIDIFGDDIFDLFNNNFIFRSLKEKRQAVVEDIMRKYHNGQKPVFEKAAELVLDHISHNSFIMKAQVFGEDNRLLFLANLSEFIYKSKYTLNEKLHLLETAALAVSKHGFGSEEYSEMLKKFSDVMNKLSQEILKNSFSFDTFFEFYKSAMNMEMYLDGKRVKTRMLEHSITSFVTSRLFDILESGLQDKDIKTFLDSFGSMFPYLTKTDITSDFILAFIIASCDKENVETIIAEI
ncbi:MAG: M48 family metalloprotease, partial [Endomicrobium sp.]|nr:M48 family metalloprotease [Endomicrobium sp.]